jgi:hypothetical protein
MFMVEHLEWAEWIIKNNSDITPKASPAREAFLFMSKTFFKAIVIK